jgi:hypothetical protein
MNRRGNTIMHALNLTIPIKQDQATMEKLAAIKAAFATQIQPKIDAALRASKIVHFARVLVIHDKFLQVITEYDGDHKAYTEFFRKELPEVFATLFSLADAPAFGDLNSDSFYELSKGLNVRSLGDSTLGETDDGGKPEGYLFSAYGNKTVRDVLQKL